MVRTILLIGVLASAGFTPGAAQPAREVAPAPRVVDPVAALGQKMPADWHGYLKDHLGKLALTPDELKTANDGDLGRLASKKMDFVTWAQAGAATASYAGRLEGAPVSRAEIAATLPRPWRAVYTARYLDDQVHNGKLLQFFWNSDGAFNETLVDDLRFLGAEKHAGLMAEAVKVYGAGRERAAKAGATGPRDALDRFAEAYKTDPYAELTATYYKLDSLTDRVGKYIKSNPTSFGRATTR